MNDEGTAGDVTTDVHVAAPAVARIDEPSAPVVGDARERAAPVTPRALRWGRESVEGGVRERLFRVDRGATTVPGLLWTPSTGSGPWPLVLMGHGAGGSKREGYVVRTARHFAASRSMAAAAIDGPIHGSRRDDPRAPSALLVMEFAQLWANEGESMTDAMVADWRAVLDALTELAELRGRRCGWWGLSMGTIIGLPFVAAEPRIAAAVFGLMGLTGPRRGRIERDAPKVRCPVLFLAQWDDAVFPREDALALFGALGSADKRLEAHVGGHGDVPRDAFASSARFLATRLAGRGSPPGGGAEATG